MEADIEEGVACIISEGSYQPELYPYLSSVTWILEANNGVGTCVRSTLDPDHDSGKLYAYQAELSGLFMDIPAILLVCTHRQLQGGHIDIGYDGYLEVNVSKSSQNSHKIS